jgi:hypothetical protein
MPPLDSRPRNSRTKLLNPSLGWTLRGWVVALVCTVGHRDPNPAAAYCSVIWSMSPMKRCLAAFAIAANLFAPVANANDALESKVRAYIPIISLAKVCDIRINDATLSEHRAMLEAVKSDPSADKFAYRVHYETQTAYIEARDGGQRVTFCRNFITANSQYAKARFTAVVEDHMSDVSTSVQKAIAHNVCGAPPRQAVQGRLETVRAHQKDASGRTKIGQGKCQDERLERHRGNDGGHGTVLRGGKNSMSITAATGGASHRGTPSAGSRRT